MTRTNHRAAGTSCALLVIGLLLTGCAATDGGEQTPQDVASTGTTTVAEARTAFDEMADMLAAGDPVGLREISSGPAAAFFIHVDHLLRASAGTPEEIFPHVHADPGEATADGDTVTFAGPVSWGDAEGPPPRMLTDLVFIKGGAGWTLDRFTRNDFPIARWVSPATEGEPVGSAPVTARVVGVFVDVTCLEEVESECPEQLTDGLAVDFEVTNDSDEPLTPGEVTLPDGSTAPAWLETPAGPHPLVDAAAQGFPAGETSPVTAFVGGVADMAEGGTLHVALQTADGRVHPLDLPVPGYPATW